MPDTGATIEIEGLDELVRKLDDLAKLTKVHAGMLAALSHIKGKIAKYPKYMRGSIPLSAVGGFSSDKQRRGFFAKLNAGEIEVPYRRGISPGSEDLAHKWTVKYDTKKFEGVVGNNASYARFVQGDKQTKMMDMIGWETVEEVSSREEKRVQEYVIDAVRRACGL